MSDQIASAPIIDLAAVFGDTVKVDDRPGYKGWIVEKDNILKTLSILKTQHGFDLLSSITAVDYLADQSFEVVYHLHKTTGGSGIEVKVRISRDEAEMPSCCAVLPGAEFQEREVWDLMGIKFTGHPDLRRILLWEGFAGHPLRKDWKEAYYEEDIKPYKTRWPEGHASRGEDHTALQDNLHFPEGFDPDTYLPEGEDALHKTLTHVSKSGLKTEQLVVNMGPQHPSTHGVFRMLAVIEGETIVDIKPVMGYLHRNHEKIGERNTWLMNMPFTDRLDYISSMSNNLGYALTVEKLMGLTIPERADYLRVIMAELTRISSHMMSVGFLLNDLGAFFTPSLYALEERELIVDIFEAVSGSRMMCNYMRFGGVARDLPEGVYERIKSLVFDRLPRKIDDYDRYLTKNEIVKTRCEGIGVLKPEDAIAMSVTGPILRASGVPYDIRRADPYSIYDRFDFDVAVGYHGDIYDRYLVRMEEMRQSVRILQQAVKGLPEGPILAGKATYMTRVPAGESYGRIESPKGELGYYIVSNGKPNPYRYHVRAPSFINLTALAQMCKGEKIADAVAVLGSIDIVLGEVDR
jgi:NADH:ubiquinone oxidoreductase subunit D/NADH:ubiquinone oxidoreductase subunit C